MSKHRLIAISMAVIIGTNIITLAMLNKTVSAEEAEASTIYPSLQPTIQPTVTPKPTTIPTPTPIIPNTLASMAEYDYVKDSVTCLDSETNLDNVTGFDGGTLSLQTLQSIVRDYGTLYRSGMSYGEYKAAMEYQWTDCTDYTAKSAAVTVDINKTMNYSSYVNTLKKLSRYDGVYLYKIGKSTKGRNIYAIEIDMGSTKEKEVFMFTGQVHAREFAGGTFLVKMLADLLSKAQKDKNTMELLKSYKYVAVPIINVDGREALIKEPRKWTYGGALWKAYSNGTDGNRNFPSVI
jgi:hypothetical protein